jgi:hypothetical protein
MMAPGCYEGALVELLGGIGDDPARPTEVLTVRVRITRARDPGGGSLVGSHIGHELVFPVEGPADASVSEERLAAWAAWITSRGWMIVTS